MAGKKDKNIPKLPRKDAELWKTMTRDVKRLPGRDYEEAGEDEKPRQSPVRERVTVRPRGEKPKKPAGGKDIAKDVDGATTRKFTRGQMAIEATLDLHGMGQAKAQEALRKFIQSSHARGKRCVLVITGKGGIGKPGVLRREVPGWLNEPPLDGIVLKIAAARPRDGGEGALYVLLRRQRD